MFDLIGFWGNVTFLTALFLFPIVMWVLPPAVHHFVKAVTLNEQLAGSMKDKVFEWVYCSYGNNYTKCFGVRLWEGFSVLMGICGLLVWLVALMGILIVSSTGTHPWHSLYEFVSIASTYAAPYTGEVAVIVAVYFIGIIVMRRAYSTYQKVEAVVKKVNEQS